MATADAAGSSKDRPRPLRASLSCLHRADGSAMVARGSTMVWAGVNGPADCSGHNRDNNGVHLDVLFNRAVVEDGRREGQWITDLIRGAVETVLDARRHPRTALALTLHEIDNEHGTGALAATALIAAAFALLDAAVPMNAVFCGVTVALHSDRHTLLLDPTGQQETAAVALFTFVLQSRDGHTDMIGCHTRGPHLFHQFQNALQLAIKASDAIFSFYRDTLQRKLSVD